MRSRLAEEIANCVMLRRSTRRSANSEIRLTRIMQLADGISALRQPQVRPSPRVVAGLEYRWVGDRTSLGHRPCLSGWIWTQSQPKCEQLPWQLCSRARKESLGCHA
ncbi:unnamed protein product [Symbiodinium pilosum]|uniref:Uncharacterized protein n=1 Tax=Symbiodinium pilosum TaxID=2952 RepID=A0A812LRZ6_SYMPI|nr:unnamed protein product [Symbiodinium pilosum]